MLRYARRHCWWIIYLQHLRLTRAIIGESKQQKHTSILALGASAEAAAAAATAASIIVALLGTLNTIPSGVGSSSGRRSLTHKQRSLLHCATNLCHLFVTTVQMVLVSYAIFISYSVVSKNCSGIFMHTKGPQLKGSTRRMNFPISNLHSSKPRVNV